jgi:DNA-binding transcriptional MocR family regulator
MENIRISKNIHTPSLDQVILYINRGVIFTPGAIFYTESILTSQNTSSLLGWDTLSLGFSRLTLNEIERGIKILGNECSNL